MTGASPSVFSRARPERRGPAPCLMLSHVLHPTDVHSGLQGVVAVTIHSAPGSGTVSPTWRRARAARIDSVAAALSDAGWPSSARLAGPMLRAVSSAA